MTNEFHLSDLSDWPEPTLSDLAAIDSEAEIMAAEEALVFAEVIWLRSGRPEDAAACWKALLNVAKQNHGFGMATLSLLVDQSNLLEVA